MNYFIESLYSLYPETVRTIGTDAFDANNNKITYDVAYVQDYADAMSCAAKAKNLLTLTDWTQANDCPLVNKAEFSAYRAAVRELAINPVTNPVFPELPSEQWN